MTATAFQYFQSVRDDIIKFATDYQDKNDFYEVFGSKICRFILNRYPQIHPITLSVDVAAYKDVTVDRGETVVLIRQTQKRKNTLPSK